MELFPIPPGYYCVPSALLALTGLDGESVVQPALNRHSRAAGLLDLVAGCSMAAATAALREWGYVVRRYRRDGAAGPLRAQVRTWARRSVERWPGRAILIATSGRDAHAMVLKDGRVYDTFTPHGEIAAEHAYARATVTWAALVEAPR